MNAQRKTRSPARRSLDPVVPTAIAALSARREALQTLREIDALLAEDSSDGSVHKKDLRKDGGPGPDAYSPHKERTLWRHGAAVKLQKPTRPHDKKTAVVIREKARHKNTPGPGTYDTQTADRVTKPRIRASSFQPKSLDDLSRVAERPTLAELEPARADKWLSRSHEPKGAVTYKPASGTTAMRSREQRERLQRLRLAKTRHLRIGFYDIRYHLTERRLGSVVPMARSASMVRDGGVSRQAQARTRRKLRAWDLSREPAPSEPSQSKETVSRHQPTRKLVTVQWKRAKARAMLKPTEHPLYHAKAVTETPYRRRDLVAHAMAKHTGRDVVRCQQKNRQVVTPFSSVTTKEPMTRSTYTPSVVSARPTANTTVRFDRMLGREESTVDASGVYLVGQDQALELRNNRLISTANDEIIRKRTPAAIISKPHATTHDDSTQQRLALSPKYGLVDSRTRGHAFVRFGNQLDREERAKEKAFRIDSEPQDSHDLPAKAIETHDALQFRRKGAGVLSFVKSVGR